MDIPLYLAGLQYGTETLKSVILTLAAMERFITTEEAVSLSRLETEYQVSFFLIWIGILIGHSYHISMTKSGSLCWIRL